MAHSAPPGAHLCSWPDADGAAEAYGLPAEALHTPCAQVAAGSPSWQTAHGLLGGQPMHLHAVHQTGGRAVEMAGPRAAQRRLWPASAAQHGLPPSAPEPAPPPSALVQLPRPGHYLLQPCPPAAPQGRARPGPGPGPAAAATSADRPSAAASASGAPGGSVAAPWCAQAVLGRQVALVADASSLAGAAEAACRGWVAGAPAEAAGRGKRAGMSQKKPGLLGGWDGARVGVVFASARALTGRVAHPPGVRVAGFRGRECERSALELRRLWRASCAVRPGLLMVASSRCGRTGCGQAGPACLPQHPRPLRGHASGKL